MNKIARKNAEVFIIGDLNCNMIKTNMLSSIIKDFMGSFGLQQIVEKPTRTTCNSSSLIDLVISNSLHISFSDIIHTGISDHDIVVLVRKWKGFYKAK